MCTQERKECDKRLNLRKEPHIFEESIILPPKIIQLRPHSSTQHLYVTLEANSDIPLSSSQEGRQAGTGYRKTNQGKKWGGKG